MHEGRDAPTVTVIEFGEALARVNAGLNATSTVLLFSAYVAVRGRKLELHRKLMWGAFATSGVFLVGYLTRFYLTGTHRFPDVGVVRTIYLVILVSHMILAALVVPLVLRTLYLGAKERFVEHRRIARYTFPIWMYVSVTGVVVYAMLYHLAPRLV